MIGFTVYGQPAPAGSKTIGRGKAGQTFVRDSSKRSYPWKRDVAQAAGIAMRGAPLLDGPLGLILTFYVPRPKGHYGSVKCKVCGGDPPGRTECCDGVGRVFRLRPSAPEFPTVKPDVLKLARAVEDALSGVVYRDDAQIVSEALQKIYGEPARCEVRVVRIGPETMTTTLDLGEEHAA